MLDHAFDQLIAQINEYVQAVETYAMVLLGALVLLALSVVTFGALLFWRLGQLVQVQRESARHVSWQSRQAFTPSPQSPYPPPIYGPRP